LILVTEIFPYCDWVASWARALQLLNFSRAVENQRGVKLTTAVALTAPDGPESLTSFEIEIQFHFQMHSTFPVSSFPRKVQRMPPAARLTAGKPGWTEPPLVDCTMGERGNW
jgi:hypothetical protein